MTQPEQSAECVAPKGPDPADVMCGLDPLAIAVEGYGMWCVWARNAPQPTTIAFRFVIPGDHFVIDFYDEGWAA